MAIGLPGDNCVDIHSQDVGLLALCENFQVVGYNVLVGGGMGVTPRNPGTFAALAQPMAPDSARASGRGGSRILLVFRDFGNRSDRCRARLRYLIAALGLEEFKSRVEARLGYPLPPPEPVEVWDIDDHIGWHEQGDGRWFHGLHVQDGRIADSGAARMKSALREICERFQPPLGLTAGQHLLFCDVPLEHRAGLDDVLRRNGVKLGRPTLQRPPLGDGLRRLAHLPAGCHRKRAALPSVLEPLEVELAKLGLADERFTLRMTGCASGCSRPYHADIGLIGDGAGRYAIHLGGCRLGNRLGFLYQEGVPLERIVSTLLPLLAYFKRDRLAPRESRRFLPAQGLRKSAGAMRRRAIA